MLLATMLNYMDRQALSQQATEISRRARSDATKIMPASRKVSDWPLPSAGLSRGSSPTGSARDGFIPACSWAGRSSGSRPAGSRAIASCSSAACCSVSSRPVNGPVPGDRAAPALSPRSAAGQQHHPERGVVGRDRHADRRVVSRDRFRRRLAAAVPRHRCGRRGLGRGLAGGGPIAGRELVSSAMPATSPGR